VTVPPPRAADDARDLVGPFISNAELLGRRTAELHLALASDRRDPAFAREPISPMYQRAMYQSVRSLASRVIRRLRTRFPSAPGAADLLDREGELVDRLGVLLRERRIRGLRIRVHGDFHLGQVLWTGSDFVVIDFEGEPARPLGERRIKRSPLADVAGMLRSFDYAAEQALRLPSVAMLVPDDPATVLRDWATAWRRWIAGAFLAEYMRAMTEASPPNASTSAGLVPVDPEEAGRLLQALVLEKAVYELGYEMNNRPDWIPTPIRGILELLDEAV
jgi:maltose alpha-D-glucosyltransferase/alpha-amylase